MAWIVLCENSQDSISSQESEELVKSWNRGCEQPPIVRTLNPAKLFSYPEWEEGRLTLLPSGMMSAASGQDTYQGSTLSLEASPARTSLLRGFDAVWQESVAAYSSRLQGSQRSFDQATSSWKTLPGSPASVGKKLFPPLPKWGMIVDGVVSPLRMWDTQPRGRDGGYWPAPTKHAQKEKGWNGEYTRQSIAVGSVAIRLTATLLGLTPQNGSDYSKLGLRLHPQFLEVLMGYSIGSTALEPWATQLTQRLRVKRSKDSSASSQPIKPKRKYTKRAKSEETAKA